LQIIKLLGNQDRCADNPYDIRQILIEKNIMAEGTGENTYENETLTKSKRFNFRIKKEIIGSIIL